MKIIHFSRGPTFIPRAPAPGGRGAGLGGGAGAGSLAGLIGGIAAPLLCLGCLSSLALLGLFATMIGAAAYMSRSFSALSRFANRFVFFFFFLDRIQQQIRKNVQGAGTMIELNFLVLFCALLCSIYVLTKHRRGVATCS